MPGVLRLLHALNMAASKILNNYHLYLKAAEDYATKRRYHLYDYSLNGRDLKLADFHRIPEFDFRMPVVTPGNALWLLLPVILLTLVLLVLGAVRCRF